MRQRFTEGGLAHAFNRLHPQHLKPHALNPAAEAHLIALTCTREEGQARLSLRLLADKMIKLGYVPAVSHDNPEHAEKNVLKPHLKERWVIPPTENAAFVAAMEDMLDLYAQPLDPLLPVICLTNDRVSCWRTC